MEILGAVLLVPLAIFAVLWSIWLGPKKEWQWTLERLAKKSCPNCGELVGLAGAAVAYEDEAIRVRANPHDLSTPFEYTEVPVTCSRCAEDLIYIVHGRELLKRNKLSNAGTPPNQQ